jgi:hypothetical protein
MDAHPFKLYTKYEKFFDYLLLTVRAAGPSGPLGPSGSYRKNHPEKSKTF